jgi:PII-like signaling protein
MPESKAAKLVRLHFCEHDRHQGRALYEAIVDKCRELKIAGATVYRGIEGYGQTAEIHRQGVLTHNAPIVVTIVDSAESIARLLPFLEDMIDKGMIAMSDVEMIRIQKSAVPQGEKDLDRP